MRVVLQVVLLAVLCFGINPVWGAGDDWKVKPTSADTSPYGVRLTPMVNGSPATSPSVRNLPRDGDRPRTQGILATTTWLKGAFSTETEVAANHAIAPEDDPSARMMRVGVVGSTGLVRYGMTYRTSDQSFHQASVQEQREAWGEWTSGALAVRSAVGERTDFESDSAVNRPQQKYKRLEVSWNKAPWPRLTLSYLHNAASNTMDVLSLYPQKANHHRVEAAMGYRAGMWDAKLASAYGLETDLQQRAADSRVQTETLTASFHPVNILTITPTVGYRIEQQPWSGARINSPSASISMNYRQSERLSMTAMGSYFSMRSNDRLIDFDMIGGKGIVSWELEAVRDWRPQLSFEGGYNLQVNRLLPSAQTENLSGLFRLVLATM
jgi:hypothetical protein